jgi:purine catabolism regulator
MDNMVKLSINEILKLKLLEHSIVLSGQKNLTRRINKVNIVVDPDIKRFLRAGEFLLSTSFFFKAMSIEEQKDFIKMLDENKIACLGIKFSPQLEKLDPKVIAYADTLDFVMFTIDFELSFTTVISSIYEMIFDRQVSILEKITKVHNHAMDILIEGGDIYEIIEVLRYSTGADVLVIDNFYDQLHFDPKTEDREGYIESISAFRNNNKKKGLIKGELRTVSVGADVYERYIFPLHVKNEIYGYIVAFLKNDQYIETNIQLIESVATIASLYFFNKLSLEEVEIGYRSEFLENLLSSDASRVDKAVERSLFFNMNQEDPYQLIQILFMDKEISGETVLKHLHKVKAITGQFDQPSILAIINNRITLLYRHSEHLQKQLERLFSQKNFLGDEFKVIVGRVVDTLRNVGKSYEDCQRIADNPNIYRDKSIVEYEKLGIYRLLIGGVDDEIIDFYEMHLKVLADYDKKRGSNLVDTLAAYFQCNGNLRKMSDILFTHYNTILYRIERIEAISGKKMDDEEDRFNLHTSLKIHNLINKKVE